MKKLFSIIAILITFSCAAQNTKEDFQKFYRETKAKTIVDRKDSSVFKILNSFYADVLQADSGELKRETIDKINKFLKSRMPKNKHLLVLFMVYQQYITETAGAGLQSNAEFQVEAINTIDKEFKEINGVSPAIVYIYKSEALTSNGNKAEAINTVMEGLLKYPDSIPLKVYRYRETKSEELKSDLITNHAKHWLVLQEGIK